MLSTSTRRAARDRGSAPAADRAADPATDPATDPVSCAPPARPAPTAAPGTGRGRHAALRNAGWMLLDKLAALVLGLVAFGWIARHFGPTGSGQLGYGLALVQTALGLSLVCSAAALLPRLYRMRQGATGALANVFVVRLAGSVLATGAVMTYAALQIDDPARRLVSLALLASVPLIEPFLTASLWWQSRNDNRRPTVSRVSGLLVRTALVALGLALGAPLAVVALAWLAEALVSAGVQLAGIRRLGALGAMARRVSSRRMRGYAAFGLRFALGLWLATLFMRLDRLVLVDLMSPHDFGLYAGAMQLIDVWTQIAYLVGFAVGPAFLYAAFQRGATWREHVPALSAFGAVGLAGVAGAALLGPWMLATVFGPAFAPAGPWLVAGAAYATLVFVDQIAQLWVTAGNRPAALAIKWATACAVALLVQRAGFAAWGAYAGPIGLGAGIAAGWLALALLAGRQRRAAAADARIAAGIAP